MDTIYVNISNVVQVNNSNRRIKYRLSNVNDKLNHLKQQIDYRIRNEHNIEKQLISINSNLNDIISHFSNIQKAIDYATANYIHAEQKIKSNSILQAKSLVGAKILDNIIINESIWNTSFLYKIINESIWNTSFLSKIIKNFQHVGSSISILSTMLHHIKEGNDDKNPFIFGEVDDEYFFTKKEQNEYSYKNKKWEKNGNDDENEYMKKVGTLAGISLGSTLFSNSLYNSEISDDDGYLTYHEKIKVFSAESTGKFNAGFYVYDNNGKKVFSPGVDAEIGVSASVLELDADGRIGVGGANIYGRGELDVGKASATANGTLSLLDENGKPNVEAHVSAELELVAVEVSGAAGVSVLGTDVGVTGSLKVGLGFEAEAGIKDGKINIHFGAAVGVGGSVGLEIDTKKTVSAVTNGCMSILNGTMNLFK